jgi:hypothetical protein
MLRDELPAKQFVQLGRGGAAASEHEQDEPRPVPPQPLDGLEQVPLTLLVFLTPEGDDDLGVFGKIEAPASRSTASLGALPEPRAVAPPLDDRHPARGEAKRLDVVVLYRTGDRVEMRGQSPRGQTVHPLDHAENPGSDPRILEADRVVRGVHQAGENPYRGAHGGQPSDEVTLQQRRVDEVGTFRPDDAADGARPAWEPPSIEVAQVEVTSNLIFNPFGAAPKTHDDRIDPT